MMARDQLASRVAQMSEEEAMDTLQMLALRSKEMRVPSLSELLDRTYTDADLSDEEAERIAADKVTAQRNLRGSRGTDGLANEGAVPVADYVDSDRWAECARPGLLADLSVEEFGLLHRHWIWANYQRTLFVEHLRTWDGEFQAWHLANEGWSTMLLWYGLLWAVIDGFADRELRFGGSFQEDISAVSDDLRRCRNAVLHVPRNGAYPDPRISSWIGRPDSAARIRRINRAFGRLFFEEMGRREATG